MFSVLRASLWAWARRATYPPFVVKATKEQAEVLQGAGRRGPGPVSGGVPGLIHQQLQQELPPLEEGEAVSATGAKDAIQK